MPTMSMPEATERIADGVEKADPSYVPEYYAEIFYGTPPAEAPPAHEFAEIIRGGLAPEEIVALWNVVFPRDRNVWYNEEEDRIFYNEEMAEYAD